LFQALQEHLLPPNHPVTIYVTRIVARLLESSKLGTVKSDQFASATPAPDDAFWQPDDADLSGDAVPGSGTKEWTVMVVNDPRTANAMAAFGAFLLICNHNRQGLMRTQEMSSFSRVYCLSAKMNTA
jgi:hypothetical protein